MKEFFILYACHVGHYLWKGEKICFSPYTSINVVMLFFLSLLATKALVWLIDEFPTVRNFVEALRVLRLSVISCVDLSSFVLDRQRHRVVAFVASKNGEWNNLFPCWTRGDRVCEVCFDFSDVFLRCWRCCWCEIKPCIAPCVQTGLPDERRAILVALIPHTHNLEHIHLLEMSSPINLIITWIRPFGSTTVWPLTWTQSPKGLRTG